MTFRIAKTGRLAAAVVTAGVVTTAGAGIASAAEDPTAVEAGVTSSVNETQDSLVSITAENVYISPSLLVANQVSPETPAEPVEEAPEVPVVEAPADEAPAEEAPADEAPAEEAPA
ncbi:MAG: hypothetical protein ACQEXN_00005, partial [Actinomycetota bacterium]